MADSSRHFYVIVYLNDHLPKLTALLIIILRIMSQNMKHEEESKVDAAAIGNTNVC